ncbi:MAG: helix-turn-helix transcriptional regulator [Bdellovibrionales bacterium]|nr:helix-turn-helix transcriptional regulator [Bdellovibrionales bacterium]
MERRNVSQGDLASGLGCSQTTVSRLLRGHTQLTVDDLFRIAKVLQVNPSVFIDQAVSKAPSIVTLSPAVQSIFCADTIGFHLFNRLKQPLTFAELAVHFSPEHLPTVRKKIQDLKQLEAVVEDIDGRLRLNYPDAESLYLVQDANYNARITEIYGRLRETKGDPAKMSDKDAEAWRRINGDALVMDYFTRPQIEEQKALLLQLFNFVRSQLRANRMTSGRTEPMELRALYLSSLSYPGLSSAKGSGSGTGQF